MNMMRQFNLLMIILKIYIYFFIIYVCLKNVIVLLQEVNSVYRILAAILNTGNIEFTSTTSQHQTDKSEVPNSEALENGESCKIC